MGLPVFIPAAEVKPGVSYRGYVATADGLVRKDQAMFTGFAHDRTGQFKQPVDASFGDWDVEPNRKRTPQERTESLAGRIWKQNTDGGGLTESIGKDAQTIINKVGREGVSEEVIRDLQALSFKAGSLRTYEECRALAALYLKQAQADWDESNRRRTTSKDAHVIDRPETARQGA